jgi:uncharacterized protein (DUF302 family)
VQYAMTVVVERPFDTVLEEVRTALTDQGFGVLTEIDLSGTLKEKIDADVPAQVILGACRPPLAHAALQADPSIGLLLPCNVTVRDSGGGQTTVEAMDPDVMVGVTGNHALEDVARDARHRLGAALRALAG